MRYLSRTVPIVAWIVVPLCATAVAATAVRRPLAVVASDLITSSDVGARAAVELRDAERIYAGKKLSRVRADIMGRTLETLIEERLYVCEGRRLAGQHRALQEWLDAEADRLIEEAARRGGNEVRYDKALRKKLEDHLLIGFIRERRVKQDATATPGEIRAYYRTHLDQFRLPLRLRYRQILVPAADFEGAEDARKRAEWIRGELAPDGSDFEQWVAKHSGGPRAAKGGLWQPGEWSADDEAVRQAILKLKQGEVSQPVKGPDGYYIFRVETVFPASVKTFRQAQGEIAGRIAAEKEERNRKELLRRLRDRFGVRTLQKP